MCKQSTKHIAQIIDKRLW